MERKLTQKDLKEALGSSFELYGAHVDKITFKTGIGADDKPEFKGADITFKEGSTNRDAGKVYHYTAGELGVMLNRQLNEEGLTIADENNEGVLNVDFEMSTRMVSGTPIPVFRGATMQCQEYDRSADMKDDLDMPEDTKIKSLVDIRRQEHIESLRRLDDYDIMDMARVHFNNHPTMPGERKLKMMVNDELANAGVLSEGQREDLINGYVNTRIRETKIDDIGWRYDVAALKSEPLSQDGTVSMSRMKVELQRMPYDTQDHQNLKSDEVNVYVLAETVDGKHETIGRLPSNFLTNNPMNVASCEAELQLTDYSNGKMKNVSLRLVVDSDLMSGDVVDLDESMLAGLDDNYGMEQ